MHKISEQPAAQHLHSDLCEVLRQAGGIGEADGQVASGSYDDRDRQSSGFATSAADSGLHQGNLFAKG
jgi:hypothetical protein